MCGMEGDETVGAFVPSWCVALLMQESDDTGAGMEELAGIILLQGLCTTLAVAGQVAAAAAVNAEVEARVLHSAADRLEHVIQSLQVIG